MRGLLQHRCSKHKTVVANSKCNDCMEYCCVECALAHDPSHKVVVLMEDALQFVRAVVNNNFQLADEQAKTQAALDRIVEVLSVYNNLQTMIKGAKLKLANISADLTREVAELDEKVATINEDLEKLKTIDGPALCAKVRQQLNEQEYDKVYQKQEEFRQIAANREILSAAHINNLIQTLSKYHDSIQKLLSHLVVIDSKARPSDPSSAPLRHLFVGRLDGFLLIYDLLAALVFGI